MPWPEPIAVLLARPASRAAQALRWGLHGLRASLRAALEEAPSDAGAEDLRALLAELTPLVDECPSSATLPLDNVAPAGGGGTAGTAWPGLSLRSPGGRTNRGVEDSTPATPRQGASLPPRPGPDPRVSQPDDEQLRPLADAVSACLWLAGHDPHARHCLKSVFRFGLAPLTGDQRDRYTAELLRLWERVRGVSDPGCKERLKAHLDLDEAIHSLIHPPPALAAPWWEQVRSQARAALYAARDQAARAGVAAHLQELGGAFAEVSRLAPDSLQVDFGVPGEVSACLRVWARVDGEELKGRALYRSPQEGA